MRRPGLLDRERGHAEYLSVGQRHLGVAAIVCHRARDDACAPGGRAEADVMARRSTQRPHVAAEVIGEGAVAPQQQSVAVEHGNGIGDRVKGLFPFALATTDEVVEARILDGHTDLPRNDPKQALIGRLEPSGISAQTVIVPAARRPREWAR
jgi:hypothetical protein